MTQKLDFLVRRLLLVIWVVNGTVLHGYAQDEIVIDSVEAIRPTQHFPVQRSVETDSVLKQTTIGYFQKEKLEKYLSDEDYQYDHQRKAEAESWWARFKQWLWKNLSGTFAPEGSGKFWRVVGWILVAALVIFAIFKIVGADLQSLFSRKPKAVELSYEEEENDIHVIDFDAMIADAIAKQQYKRATRLFYLKSLKQLSDREWIAWQPYKTNFEYVQEIKNKEVATEFRQVTYLFECIWYGDFQLTPATFSNTEKRFKELESRINRL